MKDLSEKEIYLTLYNEPRKYDVSKEELLAPNYDVWGRARQWLINHAIFLIAGVVPCDHWTFDSILPLGCDVFVMPPYGALDHKDQERLKEVYKGFVRIFNLNEKKPELNVFEPGKIVRACKNDPTIGRLIPQQLIQVVETLGPHPSFNLPPYFSNLEISTIKLTHLQLKHNLEQIHGPLERNKNISKSNESVLSLFGNRPEQLAKDILQRCAILIWKKDPNKKLHHVLDSKEFLGAAKIAAILANKPEGYERTTLAKWIRSLRPAFESKPRRKKQKITT